MKIADYKELVAYQKAYEVARLVYELTKGFSKEEIYGLTSQLRRSAVSIPSNIAEGYMRGSREYIQFLKVALGSAAELETQLSLSRDLGFCNNNVFEYVYNLNLEVIKLLKTYIKKLARGD
ncbi:MAG: four helix bundle protein [Deltaproteobacteria bacterium]|nr:four helix bundle protein [Deltaproteobacteria bacterium]